MKNLFLLIFILVFPKINLLAQSSLIIKTQKSGPFQVNSYLVIDSISKNATFIDVGSAVDSLIDYINQNQLTLNYILLTHAHQDHIVGLNTLKGKFPSAKICMSREEFEDTKHYMRWKEIFDSTLVKAWQKDSIMGNLMNFNFHTINAPDIYLEDNQKLKLGNSYISVYKTPGHSRGSLTFSVENYIFPGDLILYHSTGYLDYFLCSKDEIVKSIRKLYEYFPNETVIYAGHGKISTIGYEKSNNKSITTDMINWNY